MTKTLKGFTNIDDVCGITAHIKIIGYNKDVHMLVLQVIKYARRLLLGRNNFVLFSIFIIAFCLRIYKLGGDLYFDEGATWLVAKMLSVYDIARGNYTVEGHPALAHLVLKPLLLVAHDEVQLRFITVFFGMLSLIYVYKLFSLSQRRWLGLLAVTLIALNPVHVHYSREFRFYIIGFFAQAFSLYYYCRSMVENHNVKWIYLAVMGLLISVFTTFSSVYLILVYIISEIFIKKKYIYRDRALLLLSIVAVSISMWTVVFFVQGGGNEALYNYSGYRNREIVWQVGYTLRSLFFVRLDWGVIVDHYRADSIFEPLVRVFEVIIPFGVLLFSIYLSFLMIPLSMVERLRQRALLKFSPNERILLKFHALGFILPLFLSILFSIFAFNIVSPKLLLPMIISGIWLSLYVTKIVLQTLFKQNIYPLVFGLLIFLFMLGSGWLSFKNSMYTKYAVRPYIDQIIRNSQSRCSYVIVSHEVAMGLLKYYEYSHGMQLPATAVVIPVGYSSPSGLRKARLTFSSLRTKSDACGLVFYLKYYDFWPQSDPSYVEFSSWLSQYKLRSRQVVDSQYLSLEIYSK